MPEMAVVPPGGGWKFLQRLPDGSAKIFVESSPTKLYSVVEEYRIANSLPTEDLANEIARGVSAPVVTKLKDERSLRERVTGWLANRQFGQPKFVSPELANERAKLASVCPNNVVEYADSCLECFNSTLRGLFALRQGRTTPYDDKLGACRICGWDNKTAVHLDESLLKNRVQHLDELAKCPDCWCSKLDQKPDKELV